jgi:hypothetical protein
MMTQILPTEQVSHYEQDLYHNYKVGEDLNCVQKDWQGSIQGGGGQGVSFPPNIYAC